MIKLYFQHKLFLQQLEHESQFSYVETLKDKVRILLFEKVDLLKKMELFFK